MSDSTKAITPELIDALVKALEPKLEELVETQVKRGSCRRCGKLHPFRRCRSD